MASRSASLALGVWRLLVGGPSVAHWHLLPPHPLALALSYPSSWKWQGGGDFGGEGGSASLHGRLIAEHNFQFLAVQLPPVGEAHDALSVVGELLDVHFLADRNTEL